MVGEFRRQRKCSFFASAIEDGENLLVLTIILYEVYKRLIQHVGISATQTKLGDMLSGHVIDLNDSIALSAAQISVDLKIPMADSVILATAREYDATIWTQDIHFKDVSGVKYFRKVG